MTSLRCYCLPGFQYLASRACTYRFCTIARMSGWLFSTWQAVYRSGPARNFCTGSPRTPPKPRDHTLAGLPDAHLASQPTRRKPSPGHAVWPTPTPMSCTPPPPTFARSNTAKPLLPPLLHPFNQTWPRPETTVDSIRPPPSPQCPHPAGAPDCSAARHLPLAPSPQSPWILPPPARHGLQPGSIHTPSK